MLNESKKCAAGFEQAAVKETNPEVKRRYREIAFSIRQYVHERLVEIKNTKGFFDERMTGKKSTCSG